MKIDLSQFRDTFLQESAEHIVVIESGLLQLKAGGADDETLHSIFRAAHSIKGGAGAFGLSEVVKFTHVLENLFDQMREHRLETSPDLIGLLLRANDVLKELITSKDDTPPANAAEVQSRLESAVQNGQNTGPNSDAVPTNSGGPGVKPSSENRFFISFVPAPDLFSVGSDPLLLLRNLSAMGEVLAVKTDCASLPGLSAMIASRSYLSWEIEILTSASRGEIDDIFEFVLDCATVLVTQKSDDASPASQAIPIAPTTAGNQATSESSSTPNSPVSSRGAKPTSQPPAAASKPISPAKPSGVRTEASSSVRVPTEKIDQLIDIVGEMVIAHSITTRLVENMPNDASGALQESVAVLERHIRDLHERTMSVRMLPLGSLFSRFNRLIYDLGEKTGKQLKLVTEGDETEVDRTILELLGDPLTHVLRNSADHGIETPDVRISAGKNPEGTILLRASHQAGNILIEVIDDGAGLNLVRIREKAIAKRLIEADAVLTDDQIRLLIFAPGFSTKEEVSDLSGRGVGMDVVKKNVTALNGSISLDSNYGTGTHIKIHLPLTLAIMEGLIVRLEQHNFVIPLVSIVETLCLEVNQIRDIAGQGEIAMVRDEALPFLRLRRMFALEPSGEELETPLGDRRLLVVVEHGDFKAAMEIDELVGQQQIVVKSLERNFTRLEGTLGATILGDGKTALILDPQALMSRRSRSDGVGGRARMSLVA